MSYREELCSRLLERLGSVQRTRRGCLSWPGKKNAQGYGKIWDKEAPGKESLAHRVAYEAYYGPIPDGLCVLHRCDFPACCAKDHLFLGTRSDNAEDRGSKNRTPKGEQHYSSVLSDADVVDLRNQYAKGRPLKKIAEEFGIKYKHAWKIVKHHIRKS